ncbi:DUF3152 domain-containing protein [Yinghuangia sp. YIM S09857]|uniref:DUF3152 domain-containing protein n=1 Tax=Yinghuangia sp. YIM S09857 TaxID=3436929 RepID=UPI003F53CFCC
MTVGRHGAASYDQPHPDAPDAAQAYGQEYGRGYPQDYGYQEQSGYEAAYQQAPYAAADGGYAQQQPYPGDCAESEHYSASSGQYAAVQQHPEPYAEQYPEQYGHEYGAAEQYPAYPQYQQYADHPQYPYEPEPTRYDQGPGQQHGFDPLTDPLYGFPAAAPGQVDPLADPSLDPMAAQPGPGEYAQWAEEAPQWTDEAQQQWGTGPQAQWTADPYAGELLHSVPAQYAPEPQYRPDPEPEFDPEPAAWHETVYIEPVDDQVQASAYERGYEPRRASSPQPAPADRDGYDPPTRAGAYPVSRSTSRTAAAAPRRSAEASVPASRTASSAASRTASASPATSASAGRAASRRATRTTSRKPRRLVVAGGAVVTGAVLAGAVVMQMPDGGTEAHAKGDGAQAEDPTRRTDDVASRDAERPQVQAALPGQATPNPGSSSPAPGPTDLPIPTPSAPLSTTERMKVRFDLSETLALSGKFDVVPGKVPAPVSGAAKKYTYRVEVEQGLGLDGELFAAAVQQTLNDTRSWANGNKKSFSRTDGTADFVIRLASPGTTHKLCDMAGLDTSIQNVSCDAASTPWVVINAWRWAEGSPTFGDDMLGYRQMLINHEVGHRLGRNHETEACLPGGLAPVMMQQTKSVEADNGLMCTPNAWPYPPSIPS